VQANVGNVDRAVRIVAGVAIIAAGVYFQNWWGAAGLAPLVTGLVRWCPAYCPLKLSTVRK
jgi:sulfite exporter TauE/SafE